MMFDKLTPDCRVTLSTRSRATFTGVLHSYDEASGKIILKNVTTAGTKLYGPQHFYRSDLTNLQSLDKSICASSCKPIPEKSSSSGFKTFASTKTVPPHLLRLENIDTDELAMANIFREDNARDQGFGSGEDGPLVEIQDYYEKDGCVIICKVCDKFFESILYIMEQDVVGVTFEGVNIGRNGTLSLIQVATEDSVIVFDMLRLGKHAFDEGLQALFEASNIVKVIHDCRWISDMMQEKYNINMVNIFDTQVANAIVYKIVHKGDWPRFVESLPSCLVKHLNLPVEKVSFVKIRERLSEKDQSVWLQRPLSDSLLSAAKKNVIYLIQLRRVLINKLLYEFRIGVDIYQNHVRKLNGDIESCRNHGHLLPYAFLEIPKLVNYTFASSRHILSSDNHIKGFQDNCFDITDNQIVFSRDSVWHKSKEASGMSRKYSQQPLERGRSTSASNCGEYNINNTNNSSMNNRGYTCDSYLSDNKISEDRGIKLNKDDQQDNISYVQKENIGVNYQASNTSRQIVNNSNHMENTELENIPRNKSDSCFSVKTDKEKRLDNVDTSITERQEHQKNLSEHLLSIHRTKRLQKHAENVLPTDNIQPPLHSSSDMGSNGIRHSKLWQAVHAKHKTPELCDLSASTENSDQQEFLSGSEPECDSRQEKVPETFLKAKETFQQFDRLNFAYVEKSNKLSPSVESSSFNDPPSSLHHPLAMSRISHFSSTKTDFNNSSRCDTETILTRLVPNGTDIIQNKGLECLSAIPAGFTEMSGCKKKMMRNVNKEQKATDCNDFNEATLPQTLTPKDDFGSIPMHGSLKRQQEIPLGMPFGIGDPFSDPECSLQQSENTKLFLEPHLTFNDDSVVQDTDPESIHNLQILQKTLKVATSTSSTNLRHILLPPKTAPSGCILSHNK